MIRKLCYELYKVDWKRNHMITAEIEMDNIKEYYESLNLGVSEYGSDVKMDDTEYTYDDFMSDFGYFGSCYASYEEFLETDYLEYDYICGLLNNKELIDMYHKSI